MDHQSLTELTTGMPIVYGGNRVTHVPAELAAAFRAGDHLVVVQTTGDLLRIPGAVHSIATSAVDAATDAFAEMGSVSDAAIDAFYGHFADRLADDAAFAAIAEANEADVDAARNRGRSVTRLTLSDGMRQDMIDGLRMWAGIDSGRGAVTETIEHDGWRVEQVTAGLGVVAFVFEGRPNVFADATGVLRGGNTVVFRIGSDALGTARAIVTHALEPALEAAGLPTGAVALVDSPERSAGWALFSDSRLSLAVARGSGAAVSQLGAVARQAGVAVSLHGTGGAWIIASDHTDGDEFVAAVYHSLDRKVCNTLNTCCIPLSRVDELLPRFLESFDQTGERRDAVAKLHVTEATVSHMPESWFEEVEVRRAEGVVQEPRTDVIGDDELGLEWEWEDSPEVTLAVVDDLDDAIRRYNRLSPRFVVSLISSDADEQQRFFDSVDAPFVGNGFSRWVDGQYALDRPELGLSNWQDGRLFGRGGILSGDSVFTVRTRAVQQDPDIGR